MDCSYGSGQCGPTVTTTHTTISIPAAIQTAPGALPFTGGDVVVLGGMGFVMLLAGIVARLTAGRLR